MEDYQKRVVAEKEALDTKLVALVTFMERPVFKGLDAAEQWRMRQQSALMELYSDVLLNRIAAF